VLTPEHKEKQVTLAGDLITKADQDVDFWTTWSWCPWLNSVLMIHECHKSRCRSDWSTSRRSEKLFPGMLPKNFTHIGKIVSLSKGTTTKEILCKHM
jgi:hypothetical protein